MMEDSHVHGGEIMWRNIMAFVNNYKIKWLSADLILVADSLNHGMGTAEYHELFSVFGIKPSAVDAGVTILALIRVGVLLYKRTVHSKAECPVPCALHDEEKLGKD